MSVLRVLHLVGSAVSDFYCNLSRLYAQDCLDDLDQPFDTQENSKEPCHQESTSEMSHEDKNNI